MTVRLEFKFLLCITRPVSKLL